MNTKEENRIDSLLSYGVMDSPSEIEFDDIVSLASSICESPIAFLGFMDEKRLWYKARLGLESTQISRDISICDHVLQTQQTLIVEDLKDDSRFADKPFVKDTDGIRFYLGLPIVCPEGFILGTLCVADYVPRKLSPHQIASVTALARQVVQNLKCKKHNKEVQNQNDKLRDTNKSISLGMFSIYMAHEINNALTIAEGYTACAIRELTKRDNIQDNLFPLLSLIQNSNSRIAKIVSGIKIYSRNAKNDPFELFSVKQIMQETYALCREKCKIEGVDLTLVLPADELFIQTTVNT